MEKWHDLIKNDLIKNDGFSGMGSGLVYGTRKKRIIPVPDAKSPSNL